MMQSAQLELVTPQQAEVWLSQNPGNRAICSTLVDRLAAHMKGGTFLLNGDTITLDEHGALLDGQHRLSAVVKSGVAQKMWIIRGVPRNAMITKDRGRARTAADWAQIQGHKNCSALAAAAKLLFAFEAGSLNMASATGSFNPAGYDAVVARHPLLHNSASVVMGSLRSGLKDVHRSDSTFVLFHYLFGRADSSKRDDFFEKVSTGANLTINDPVLRLREVLIRSRNDRSAKLTGLAVQILIIKAWNAFFLGQTKKVLRWSPDANEKMPQIEGLKYAVDGTPQL